MPNQQISQVECAGKNRKHLKFALVHFLLCLCVQSLCVRVRHSAMQPGIDLILVLLGNSFPFNQLSFYRIFIVFEIFLIC